MLLSWAPGRLALRRVVADRGVALLAWLLLAAGATLPAAGLLYSDEVAIGSLRASFDAAPPGARGAVVLIDAPGPEIGRIDPAVAAEVGRALESVGGSVSLVLRVEDLALQSGGAGAARGATPSAGTGTASGTQRTQLASFEGLAGHATLVDGAWAVAGSTPFQATLSEGAAAALHLGLGDVVTMVSPRDPTVSVRLALTGIWRPARDDAYWLGNRLDLDGSETVVNTTSGPFVVARADLLALFPRASVAAEWHVVPDPLGLTADRLDALRTGVGELGPRVAADLTAGRAVTVATGLPDLLDRIGQAAFVGRAIVALLVAQLALLAGYALFLVGGVLRERRREETTMLRERGADTLDVAAVAVAEGAILAVPAAVVAAWLAVGLVHALATAGPLAGTGVIASDGALPPPYVPAAAAAGLGVLVLALPTLVAGFGGIGTRLTLGRRLGRTLGQRLGLDLVLLGLAAMAVWQLRIYGVPLVRTASGGPGLDPLLALTPSIGLLAGGLAVVRLVPRIAELAERAFVRLVGTVLPLAAREVARRPQRHTRVVLLVVLAAAFGGLASAHAATWSRSQLDQAAYQAPSDVRVVAAAGSTVPGWLPGPAYRGLPGVTRADPVLRETIGEGPAAGGQVLALDPVATLRLPDLPEGAVSGLEALTGSAMPEPTAAGAPMLPAGTRRLAVIVSTDVGPAAGAAGTGAGQVPGPGVSVVLQDSDGLLHVADGGTLAPTGAGQRAVVALAGTVGGLGIVPADGIRIVAIDLAIAPAARTPVAGSIRIEGIAASPAERGGDWTGVPFDPGTTKWTWLRMGLHRSEALGPAVTAGQLAFGTGGAATPAADAPTPAVGADGSPAPVTFRLLSPQPGLSPLPAIASPAFLARTGAGLGDIVDGGFLGDGVRLRVVASAPLFPPLDPDRPFVVVDRGSLVRTLFSAGGRVDQVSEWWLTVRGASAPVTRLLRSGTYPVGQVVDRTELAAAGASDPIALGVIGAFGLGALSAFVFATLGFVVHASISTRERLLEFAVMRALGVSRGQLLAWLWIEHASILAFGLFVGSGLGLLLTWLIVPSATLTASGATPVPAPAIVVPLLFPLALVGVAAVLLVVTVTLLGRLVESIPVAAVIREREV